MTITTGSRNSVVMASVRGVLFGVVVVATTMPATAGTCLEEVNRIASDYNLSINPPNVPAGDAQNGISTHDLARSGGVIEPHKTGDSAIIEPDGEARYGMKTVPDITPQAPGNSPGLAADDLIVLEAMLVAARAEANRGDETGCLKRLQEARRFVGKQ